MLLVEQDTRQALEFLAWLGVDVQGRPMFERDGVRMWGPAARRYAFANPVGPWAAEVPSPLVRVQQSVARKLDTLADARLVGII